MGSLKLVYFSFHADIGYSKYCLTDGKSFEYPLWQASPSPFVLQFAAAGDRNSGFGFKNVSRGGCTLIQCQFSWPVGGQRRSLYWSMISTDTGARELAFWKVNLAARPQPTLYLPAIHYPSDILRNITSL